MFDATRAQELLGTPVSEATVTTMTGRAAQGLTGFLDPVGFQNWAVGLDLRI